MDSPPRTVYVVNGREYELAVGFRFQPTDTYMISSLKEKIIDDENFSDPIPTIDNLYQLSPEEIPLDEYKHMSHTDHSSTNLQWIFFSNRSPLSHGNLSTRDGYWLPEDSLTVIREEGIVIGFMQAVHFYRGNSPNGRKINWSVHEYRLNPRVQVDENMNEETKDKVTNMVACKIIRRGRARRI